MRLEDMRLATEDEIESVDRPARTYLLKPQDLSPLEAYLALRDSFGEPNGYYFDEGKTQWEYDLRYDSVHIEVYDWKLEGWSIAVFTADGEEETGEKTAEALLEHVRKKASYHKSRIKTISAQPAGHVIQCPFSLYYETASGLLDYASSRESVTRLPSVTDLEEFLSDGASNRLSQRDLCRSAFLLYIASFEGLLNLIYELYLKKELRDDRIYGRLGREQIDIKLRLAPLYCECFQNNLIDHTSDQFRNFLSIVNLRNDFVHANFMTPMRIPIIVEDDYTFVIEPVDTAFRGIPRSFAELEAEHIETVKQAIDDMIEKLLDHMQPRFKREFKEIINRDYIEVGYEDGVMVVIL
jgi:hypothetical protein